jgi:hypothetical protein
MKRHLLIVLLIFSALVSNEMAAQQERLSAFSYVVVPERFDFQYETDQYQLNSLLKFLFNKYGFHAFFSSELPEVSRCDGLYAEIEQLNGFVWTELSVRLVDCDGVLFYQTKTGRSKLKNYAKAYVEALRMAFESIEILGVRQGPMQILQKPGGESAVIESSQETKKPISTMEESSMVSTNQSSGQDTKTTTPNDQSPMKDETVVLGLLPDVPLMNFVSSDVSYLLRRTDLGYQWYQESTQDLIYQGKFFVVEQMLFYEDKQGIRYTAEYRDQGELVLRREGEELIFHKAN